MPALLAGAGWRALVPLAGLAAIAATVFHEALLGPRVFFQRDIAGYWYPLIESFAHVVAGGAWPVWNPWISLGLPMWADPNYQILYPPTWIALLVPPAAYFKLFAFAHCLAGGAGTYFLGRRLGLGTLAAWTGGAVWLSSGPLLSSLSLFHHFAGAAWMPWVLLAAECALQRGAVGSSLLLGAVGAGQVLAGSADMVFFTCLMATARAVAWCVSGPSGLAERLVRLGRVTAIAVSFGLALAAVQWVPTASQLGSGSRLNLDPAVNLYWSTHPLSLVDMLVPRLVTGLPLGAAGLAGLFESREPLLACLYLGLPAAVLAVAAVVLGRSAVPWMLGAGVVFLIVAALGRHTLLLPALLRFPGFSLFRYPGKYLVPACLPWALLTAFGVELLRRRWGGGERRRAGGLAVATAVCALALLLLAQRLRDDPTLLADILVGPALVAQHRAAEKLVQAACLGLCCALLLVLRTLRPEPSLRVAGAFAVLAVVDLVAVGQAVNPLARPDLLLHRPPALQALRADSDARVFVVPYALPWLRAQVSPVTPDWRPEEAWTLGLADLLFPPTAARFGVSGSFDGDFTGLTPRAISMLSRLVQEAQGSQRALRLLRIAGVTHVVGLHVPFLDGIEEVGEFPSVFKRPVKVFRITHPLPRVYVVSRVREVSDQRAMELLVDPRFDPDSEVLLPERAGIEPIPEGPRGSCRVIDKRADRITVEVELQAAGVLVVAESFDPGWRATVDGVPAEVSRANLMFQGVRLTAGTHLVELRYRPRPIFWGGVISAAAASLGLFVAIARLARRRRGIAHEPSTL